MSDDGIIAIEQANQVIRQWHNHSGYDSLFVRRLALDGFSRVQISIILREIDNTCNHCWDGDADCQCWNDK